MTDKEIINVGDICLYFYDNDNKSISIVEVVKDLSTDVLVVKFLQVVVDDSGNGLFDYMYRAEKTMNVSRKYLHKIDLISRQQAEIENLKIENKSLRSAANSYKLHYNEAGTEAIKEFAKRLKNSIYINTNLLVYQCEDVESVIDDIVKEMVGETNDI